MSRARHAVVGAAIGGTSLLAGIGVIGGGDHPERFETWQVIIEPAGADALRITETFDQDFGDERRRGHERFVPNEFGVPTDVVASSPDAPDDVSVVPLGADTRIRIGDPDVTISGQHRYTLAYTLPDAMLERGFLAIDALDGDEFETLFAEVVVRGFELGEPRCFAGVAGSVDQCDLATDGGLYRAVFEPLPPNTGVTIDGTILGATDPAPVDELPIPERRTSRRGVAALGMAGLGLVGAVPVYRWARRRGSNEVFAGGAADAAYGALPAPGSDGETAPPVELVSDAELGDLATIEFVPPKGIDPWEASVLLTERVGDDSVEAWLSGLAGSEAIDLDERGDDLVIGSGPRRGELDDHDAALLDQILSLSDPYVTGKYDQRFAAAWTRVASDQRRRIAASGWWKHLPPGGGFRPKVSGSPYGLIMLAVFFAVWSGSAATALLGVFSSWPLAIALGLAFPAVVAYFVYRTLLPARSAQGSALALRAESFRRFLHASEGRHVEWAWSQGLLREYSGWAVALGEADAWSDALERSNVPAPARAAAGPIIVHRRGPSMRTTRTAPASTGGRSGMRSGRSGGFGGGRVGGGGGGGSRGSW